MTNLPQKSDLQLIRQVRNKNSSEAFLELCKRVEKLFYNVCHKYSTPLRSHGIDPNDIMAEKDAIIYFCVQNFDHKKGSKFSTYVGNYARFLCLNSINARKFILPSSDDEMAKVIEESQVKDNYFHNSPVQEDYNHLNNLINEFQDKRIAEIFKYRYFGDKKMIWAEVAEKMKMSAQSVMNLNSRGLTLLKNRLKSRSNAQNYE